jgi:hypothetical protein
MEMKDPEMRHALLQTALASTVSAVQVKKTAAGTEPTSAPAAHAGSVIDFSHGYLDIALEHKDRASLVLLLKHARAASQHCSVRPLWHVIDALPRIHKQYSTCVLAFFAGMKLQGARQMRPTSRVLLETRMITLSRFTTPDAASLMWKRNLEAHTCVSLAEHEEQGGPVHSVYSPWPGIASRAVLQTLVSLDSSVFKDNEVVSAALSALWHDYGRRRYIWGLCKYLMFACCFTAFTMHSARANESSPTELSDMASATAAISAAGSVHFLFLEGKQLAAQELAVGPAGARTSRLERVVRAVPGLQLITEYLSDPWNCLDVVVHTCVLGSIGSRATGQAPATSQAWAAFANVFLWLNLSFYLRGFPATGPLIRMVLEICCSMRAFFLLLGIMFVGFSAAFTVLFEAAWLESYRDEHGHRMPFETMGRSAFTLFLILLGDFDTDMFEYATVPGYAIAFFIVFVLAVVIVMLNLLIALMGDAYGRVQAVARPEFLKERAKIILELTTAADEERLDLKNACVFQLSQTDHDEVDDSATRMQKDEVSMRLEAVQAQQASMQSEMAAALRKMEASFDALNAATQASAAQNATTQRLLAKLVKGK